jgi:hypothetical protein
MVANALLLLCVGGSSQPIRVSEFMFLKLLVFPAENVLLSKCRLTRFPLSVPQHHGRHRDNATTCVGIADGDAQVRSEERKAYKSSVSDLPEAQICLSVVSTES